MSMATESVVAQSKSHVPKLVLTKNAQEAVHGSSAIGRFNTRIAVSITKIVGSMWCAYVFALIALISFPAAISTGQPIIIVAWIAQTFLQLVLLPIIIVGQNVQAAASDGRAESDHKTLIAIHTLTAEIHAIDERHSKILKLIEERTEGRDASASVKA